MTSPSEPTQKSIFLKSNRLSVEIALPGTAYARTRFDWSGFITQVILDSQHTFCVRENGDPTQGSGGIGLCNEFGIDAPIGYADALPGECFLKPGVGLLVRPDDPEYGFHKPYQLAQPFPISVEADERTAQFDLGALECRGYGIHLTKTVSIHENRLTVAYFCENVGSRDLQTNEYMHNFVRIDQHKIGAEYVLRFGPEISYEDIPGGEKVRETLTSHGHEMSWKVPPEQGFYARLLGAEKSSEPQWELTHTPSQIRLSETVDFAPVRVALWGVDHVCSPEIFIGLNLKPGESQAWKRVYAFSGGI